MPPARRSASRASTAPETAATTARPEVIVDFRFDRGLLHVAVANIGDAPAHRVTVRFDKKFRGLGGSCEISALRLFRRIEFLAPRKTIETLIDTTRAYFARREPTKLTAAIAFRDPQGRVHKRLITHDLSIYKDLVYLAGPSAPETRSPTQATGDLSHGRFPR